jgi:hypothetical protein
VLGRHLALCEFLHKIHAFGEAGLAGQPGQQVLASWQRIIWLARNACLSVARTTNADLPVKPMPCVQMTRAAKLGIFGSLYRCGVNQIRLFRLIIAAQRSFSATDCLVL